MSPAETARPRTYLSPLRSIETIYGEESQGLGWGTPTSEPPDEEAGEITLPTAEEVSREEEELSDQPEEQQCSPVENYSVADGPSSQDTGNQGCTDSVPSAESQPAKKPLETQEKLGRGRRVKRPPDRYD